MALDLVPFQSLQLEQQTVLNIGVSTNHPVVLVQGVAGSGKTTLALHSILNHLADALRSHRGHPTSLLLTYGSHLRDRCHDMLQTELSRRRIQASLSPPGKILARTVNVVTYRDFLDALLPEDLRERSVSDHESLEIIRDILIRTTVYDLLPSQVLSVVTAFVKGNKAIVDPAADTILASLGGVVDEADPRHPMNNTYWALAGRIVSRLYGVYQSRLGGRLDRADLARALLDHAAGGGPRARQLSRLTTELLPDPYLVVDEVQDLSSIECEALLSVWFKVVCRGWLGRLTLFGDINQQLSPTGFTWESVMSAVYSYTAMPVRFTEEEAGSDPSPYRILNNNYRTSEALAAFVRDFMDNAGLPNLADGVRYEYRRRIIDPDRTLSEEGDRPVVAICNKSIFLQALADYLAERYAPSKPLVDGVEPSTSPVTFMIITNRSHELKNSDAHHLGAEPAGSAATSVALALSSLAILDCKGLEFDAAVIWGLPTAGLGTKPTPDVIAQWYTALTRSRRRLLLVLNEVELEYLRKWSTEFPFGSDVATIYDPVDGAAVLLGLFRWVGTTTLGREELVRLAERSYEQFCRTFDIQFLTTAKLYMRLAKEDAEYRRMVVDGARVLEKAGQLREAAELFEDGGELLMAVTCLVRAQETSKARALVSRVSGSNASYRGIELAECWRALGDFTEAVRSYLDASDYQNAERVAALATPSGGGRACWIMIQDRYWQNGPLFWPDSAACAGKVGNREHVVSLDSKLMNRGDFETAVKCWIAFGDMERAKLIAAERQNRGEIASAAVCWAAVGDHLKAAVLWQQIDSLDRARQCLEALETKEPGAAAIAWYRQFKDPNRATAVIERMWRAGRHRDAVEACVTTGELALADRLRTSLNPFTDFKLALVL